MNNSEALTTLIVGGRTAKEYSQRELARRVGKSRSYVTNMIGLLTLPDDVKRMVEKRSLSICLHCIYVFILSILKNICIFVIKMQR